MTLLWFNTSTPYVLEEHIYGKKKKSHLKCPFSCCSCSFLESNSILPCFGYRTLQSMLLTTATLCTHKYFTAVNKDHVTFHHQFLFPLKAESNRYFVTDLGVSWEFVRSSVFINRNTYCYHRKFVHIRLKQGCSYKVENEATKD